MNAPHTTYVVCTRNTDCDDLSLRTIYQCLPDDQAAGRGFIRVIDDSGEDYLYPASFFVPIELPVDVERALKLAS